MTDLIFSKDREDVILGLVMLTETHSKKELIEIFGYYDETYNPSRITIQGCKGYKVDRDGFFQCNLSTETIILIFPEYLIWVNRCICLLNKNFEHGTHETRDYTVIIK